MSNSVVIHRRPRSQTVNPASLDEVRQLVGKYCDFNWLDHNGREGGMAGILEKVEQDDAGVWWAVVDYGYGAAIGHFTIREATEPQSATLTQVSTSGDSVNPADARSAALPEGQE